MPPMCANRRARGHSNRAGTLRIVRVGPPAGLTARAGPEARPESARRTSETDGREHIRCSGGTPGVIRGNPVAAWPWTADLKIRRVGGRVGKSEVAIMAESSQAAPGKIFISYRRDETSRLAGRLYDALTGRFQVFMDVESIAPGGELAAINTAVESCDVLLALIGKEWLTVKEADGSRRIDNPKDWVRWEIEAALAHNVPVIPILIDGAGMPKADDLPPSLAEMRSRNGLDLDQGRFRAGLSRLVDGIGTIIRVEEQWITVYDSHSSGFSLSDFHPDFFEGAAANLRVTQEAGNDTLVIDRNNNDGQVVLWLKKYDYINSPNVIPRRGPWGTRRTFRIRCKVQAHDAAHTFNLMLKQVGTQRNIYADLKSHRITPDTDTLTPPIDDQFNVLLTGDCELRLEDRDVSAAPTRLEIRDLIVTERKPPSNPIPAAPN
jgi:hypothetical protein